MQFITTGNRIAVENFTIGDLYTITFTNGNYINSACIGIGANFVTFQRNEPELLFSLTMETAELVSTIDLYAAGSGTNNYNELQNKPAINSVELVGNKSLSDLGIQAEITAESPLSSALISGLGSAAAADTSDFATAAQGALADSAVQPDDMTAALTLKQDALTSAQLDAVNSGITSTDVAQIGINENNILSNQNGLKILTANGGGINYATVASGTATDSSWYNMNIDLPAGTYVLYFGSLTSTDTDSSTIQIALFDDSDNAKYFQSARGTDVYTEFTTDVHRKVLRIYKADTNAHGSGDTMNFTNCMICTKSAWQSLGTYQPYAPSNRELYEMILALQ